MNFKYPIILASKSPRRQQLLKEMGFNFTTQASDIEETYPDDLRIEEVPEFLACKKAASITRTINNEIVIASDTIVALEGQILEKPKNYEDAFSMIQDMSAKTHDVITGVCIMSKQHTISFIDTTSVTFRPITTDEIGFYLNTFKPYDKAGSYGIQEWLGMVAIEKIEGSYFNVVGLPTEKLYKALTSFNK